MLPSISKVDSPISKITVALNDKESQARLRQSFHGRLEPSNILCGRNIDAVKNADAVLFAFPPEKIQEVLAGDEMRESLRNKHIISILARTPRAKVAQIINPPGGLTSSTFDDLRIVRAMPTMGAEVHESATLIGKSNNPLEQQAMELAQWIFSSVGKVFHVDHDYFESATGMSAFTNALITTAIQAISQQAIAEGVPKEHAVAITSQCVRGMASLILSGKSPEHLQWSLSAPGSITGQAITTLQGSQLSTILERSLSAAISRAKHYER